MTIAGDGTPVVTAAYPRSKPLYDCHARGIAKGSHPRLFSQPYCDSGWDSSREKYFNGYHLYMLTAENSHYDLPLYPRLQPASRHDAVSFVVSTVEFSQRFTLGMVGKMLLDAAQDAGAIYDLLAHQHIEPFIDVNVRGVKPLETESNIRISPKGIPICPAGLEMNRNGYDQSQKRFKWLCPMMTSRTECSCDTPCSTAKYGRSFHTKSQDNPRLFPQTPRDSEAWKLTYKPVHADSIKKIVYSPVKHKVPQLIEAVNGRIRAHHQSMIRMYLDHLRYVERLIAEIEHEVDELLITYKEHIELLITIPS